MTLEFALEFITGNVRLAEDSIIRNLVQHGETSKTVQAAIEEFNWLVGSIGDFCREVRMRRGPRPSFSADSPLIHEAREAILKSPNPTHATLVRIAVLDVMLRHQFAECRHIAKHGKEAK